VSTDGIEFVVGTGLARDNVVKRNLCAASSTTCGPDFFNEFQHAGIAAGAGVTIEGNRVAGNHVGIYVGENPVLRDNVLKGNVYFALALQDGDFVVEGDSIRGPGGGVAVIASAVDTSVVLKGVTIQGVSGKQVQRFECCGFTATFIRTH
jgi:parallel beta-helix repeat protein